MHIEKAHTNDSEILTQITMISKAFWGYSEEQMTSWFPVLTITKTYLETKEIYKLIVNNVVVGYYSFYKQNYSELILDNLFLLPEFIGKGIVSMLMNNFLNRIQDLGFTKVIVESDPNAEHFYEKFGFVKVQQIETVINNRFIPQMELKLTPN